MKDICFKFLSHDDKFVTIQDFLAIKDQFVFSFIPLQDNKILTISKLKAFADNFNVAQ